MVFTLSIYKTAAKLKKLMALKKLLHQVEKYYSVATKKKQKTSLLKSKSCKHALHH
jgi:hypothetical protein